MDFSFSPAIITTTCRCHLLINCHRSTRQHNRHLWKPMRSVFFPLRERVSADEFTHLLEGWLSYLGKKSVKQLIAVLFTHPPSLGYNFEPTIWFLARQQISQKNITTGQICDYWLYPPTVNHSNVKCYWSIPQHWHSNNSRSSCLTQLFLLYVGGKN